LLHSGLPLPHRHINHTLRVGEVTSSFLLQYSHFQITFLLGSLGNITIILHKTFQNLYSIPILNL